MADKSNYTNKLFESLKEALDENTEKLKELKQEYHELPDQRKGRHIREAIKELEEKRSRQLATLGGEYSGTAKTVSRLTGMDVGIRRVMENEMANIINKDENVRSALRIGDSDKVREEMVKSLTKIAEGMEFSSKKEEENFRFLITNINENFKEVFDWDKIEARGMSIFYPLTRKFFEGAEMMRSTIVDKFPITMRFLSRDMVEHYRQGIVQVSDMVKKEFAPILAPIDALVGPFKAVLTGGFMLMKTFFSHSTEFEQSTAENTAKMVALMEESQDDAKRAADLGPTKKKTIWAKILDFGISILSGIYISIRTGLGKIFGPVGKMLGGVLGPVGKVFGFIGKVVNRVIMPLMMIFNAVNEAMNAWKDTGSIRETILAFSAGLLETLFEIPELLINTVLGAFTDFRVDFSSEKIIEMVNGFSDWLYVNVTEPFLDKVVGLWDSLTNALKGVPDLMANMFIFIKNSLIDLLINFMGDWGFGIGDKVRELEKYKSPYVGGAPVKKATAGTPSTTGVTTAQAQTTATQIATNRETTAALGETNRNITENTRVTQQSVESQQNVTIIEGKEEIPSEPESMGVLMHTKSWGMG